VLYSCVSVPVCESNTYSPLVQVTVTYVRFAALPAWKLVYVSPVQNCRESPLSPFPPKHALKHWVGSSLSDLSCCSSFCEPSISAISCKAKVHDVFGMVGGASTKPRADFFVSSPLGPKWSLFLLSVWHIFWNPFDSRGLFGILSNLHPAYYLTFIPQSSLNPTLGLNPKR
jgi:hypothetical protein